MLPYDEFYNSVETPLKPAAVEVILLKHYCAPTTSPLIKDHFSNTKINLGTNSAAFTPTLTKQKSRGTKLLTPTDQAFKAGNWFWLSCALNYILLRIFL